MVAGAALGLLVLGGGLSGCKQSSDAGPEATEVPASFATNASAAKVVESDYGTPVKDRVATLGLLNKRNNMVQDLVMKTGESLPVSL